MAQSSHRLSILPGLILGSASMLNAASIALSGTVTDLAGHPLFGAAIQVANHVTGTDSSGSWTISDLGGPTRIAERFRDPLPISGNLSLGRDHLQLKLGSSNILGRRLPLSGALPMVANASAARAAVASPTDSLWIAWNGRIRTRFGGASLAPTHVGTVAIDTTSSPGEPSCPGAIACGTMTDPRDGQVYRTVTIGTQTWMAQNMNYSLSSEQALCRDTVGGSHDLTYARSWCNDSSPAVGKFYTLITRDGPADPCPIGWHLPTSGEWDLLVASVGGPSVAGRMLKSATGWESSGNGLGAGGFNALPVGYGYAWQPSSASVFLSTAASGIRAVFRTATSVAPDSSYVAFRSDTSSADRANWRISLSFGLVTEHGASVRCVED